MDVGGQNEQAAKIHTLALGRAPFILFGVSIKTLLSVDGTGPPNDDTRFLTHSMFTLLTMG